MDVFKPHGLLSAFHFKSKGFKYAVKLFCLIAIPFTATLAPQTIAAPQRTIMLIEGTTISGQDMFFRGGIDVNWSNANRGTQCTGSTVAGGNQNIPCSMPITHLNLIHANTKPWRIGDFYLDWGKLVPANDGREPLQTGVNGAGQTAVGTPAVWTTNDPNYAKKIYIAGNGYTPLNTYGPHYWLLDVEMECDKAVGGWFEFKTFISNGPAWEADVDQNQFMGFTPPPFGASSKNHMGRCGMINVFRRGFNEPVDIKAFPAGWPVASYSITANGGVIAFDAAGSTNATQYRWDLNGDDVYDTEWSTAKTTSTIFAQPGSYKARLWARDEIGKDSYSIKSFTIAAVPNVVGQAQSTAQASLTAAGYTIGNITQQANSNIPAGSVISQSLAANSLSLAGAAVDLVVSSNSGQILKFHLRGTHNIAPDATWREGDLFTPVSGSTTNYEICRNFTSGDVNGGPRFKIDPNGGWGADAFPVTDVIASGWTKVVINASTKTIVSTTLDMAPNCAVAPVGFHLRGTHNQINSPWSEGDLFKPVIGSSTNYEICRNFVRGDAKGGPRFKVDPNGGWGDSFPAADAPASGWSKIVINGSTKTLVSTTTNMAPNCIAPLLGYHLRGTHNQWLENDLFDFTAASINIPGSRYSICRNFTLGDANGGPRFKIDKDGGWGADAFPADADIPASGWTMVSFFNTPANNFLVTTSLGPNCSTPPSKFHLRGTHFQWNKVWLAGDYFKPVVGTANKFEICRQFPLGDANDLPRFRIDPNGDWGGDEFPATDVPASGWTKVVINGDTNTIESTTVNMTTNCGSATVMSAWMSRQNTDVNFPVSANGFSFLRSSESNCDVTNILNCLNGQQTTLNGLAVSDTAATLERTGYYLLKNGISQASLTISSTEDPKLLSREESKLISFKNKYWIIGGRINGEYKDDIWSSKDGVRWIKEASREFPARYKHQIIEVQGRLWLYGGVNEFGILNDIWVSDDGIEWQQTGGINRFTPRVNGQLEYFQGTFWMIGGNDGNNLLNDVWSSNNGIDWTLQLSNAPFSARENHRVVVTNTFKTMMLIGGFANDGLKNDIWRTSDGVHWVLESANPEFSPRQNFQLIQHGPNLIMIGGFDNASALNEIWIEGSSQLGVRAWTKQIDSTLLFARGAMQFAELDKRLLLIGGQDSSGKRRDDAMVSSDGVNWSSPVAAFTKTTVSDNRVVAFNNKLWQVGGYSIKDGYKNDIWSSADGVSWTQEKSQAEFSKRGFHSLVVFNNKLWLIGGSDGDEAAGKNDVWSSVDGVTWIQSISNADFSPRWNQQVVVHNNKMFLIGGFDSVLGSYTNDIWSSVDGINWIKQPMPAFSPREASQIVSFNGKLWLFGGYNPNEGYKNDIWSSADAITWTKSVTTKPFSKRYGHQVTVYLNNLWLTGGSEFDQLKAEVWASIDGVNWDLSNQMDLPALAFHSAATLNNKLILIGGKRETRDFSDEIWAFQNGTWRLGFNGVFDFSQ